MLDVSTSTANTKAPFIISEDKELHVQYGTIRSSLVFPITAFKPEHTADVGLQCRRGGTSLQRRPGARPNGSPAVNDFQIISTNAADIEPQPITWLWRNRFPQGMITLLGGEGGTPSLSEVSGHMGRVGHHSEELLSSVPRMTPHRSSSLDLWPMVPTGLRSRL